MENNILNGENSENLNQENSSFFDEKVSSSNSNEEQPKLRFKNPNGHYYENWEIACLGNFIQEISQLTSDTEQYPLYSLTLENGVTPKSSRYEREFLITKEGDSYKIVPPQAFVYNPMNLRFGALAANHNDFKVSVSGYYDVFYMGNKNTLTFWENYLTTPKMLHYYFTIATGSLIEKLRVHFTQFVKIEKKVPCIDEQQKIADFLSLVNKRIDKQRQLVENLKKYKRGLLSAIFERKIRFKDDNGNDYPEWETATIKDTLNYEQPQKYIVETENYSNDYTTPVLTANKAFLLGYTNETEGIYDKGNTIIYDDFTMDFKFVDFKFKVKSSTIKMLTEKENYNLYFMFNLLIYLNLKPQGHQRSYLSILEPMKILCPTFDEQNKIASFLYNIDKKIEHKIEYLQQLEFAKKGLLQQMFI